MRPTCTEMSVRKAASPRSISSQTSASETKSSPAPPYSSGIVIPRRPELGHALDDAHVEVVVDVVLDRVRKDALVHELANGRLHLALLGLSSKSTRFSLRGRFRRRLCSRSSYVEPWVWPVRAVVDSPSSMRAEAGIEPIRRGRSAPARREWRRLVRTGAKIAGAALLVLFVFLLVAGVVFAGSADKVAGGVTVAGMDVDGLDAQHAQAPSRLARGASKQCPSSSRPAASAGRSRRSRSPSGSTGRRPRRPLWTRATGPSLCVG